MGSDTRAGSHVTVCGLRLVFCHRTEYPRPTEATFGSNRRSGVMLTVVATAGDGLATAATAWADGLAAATGLAPPSTLNPPEALAAGAGPGVLAPTIVGGGLTSVGAP